MNYPKISIVTPSYNQGQYIEQTIQSVLIQHYPNLEYIIIDGGSTDNTVEIIKKYEKSLKYWVSEPDKGQAHAINKGIKHCTGEIFNWLNSDDYLEPEALYKITERFEQEDKPDLVAGEVEIFDSHGPVEYVKHQKLSAKGLLTWEQGVTFVQPGVWMRTGCVQKCGGIDEQFHYAFDWDLLIRYLCKFPKVAFLAEKLINFRYHEASKTVSSRHKFSEEENCIIKKISSIDQFKDLHKICRRKLALIEWMPVLKQIKGGDSSMIGKLKSILGQHKIKYLSIWRVTLGTIKQIIIHEH